MKYILFGAGDAGIRALRTIGEENVEYYADNFKVGMTVQGKKVISFNDMTALAKEYCIVISTVEYVEAMEQQLINAGVTDYLIFNRRYLPEMITVLPQYNYLHNTQYMTYMDVLLNYQIYKYTNITIVGVNQFLKNLLFEIDIIAGSGKVKAIVGDSDVNDYYGIPNVKEKAIPDDTDCLIINVQRIHSDIRERIDYNKFDIADIYDIDRFVFYNCHPELKRFKNLHKGKRAFIVGNGPSVRMEDLDTLYRNNEICFGMNKIHKIFNQTKWRPKYTCMSDTRAILACENSFEYLLDETTIFIADRYTIKKANINKRLNYLHLKSEYYMPNSPGFSDDITTGVYWGFTVTYDIALQIAAYMGFSEIYLIGIDHNNIGAVTNPQNHFIKDYFDKSEEATYKNVITNFEAITKAYEKAEKYSRTHGFRIYNATRGGNLEVFDRVNFDDLFNI